MSTALRIAAATLVLIGAAAGAATVRPSYVNTTAGGPLRAGVYGRIDIGKAPPPPVIHPRPVTATQSLGDGLQSPVYLYVPPGHVRKWTKNCHRYGACNLPVYFVRMDDSPSRLGKWKTLARAGQGEPGVLHASSQVRD